MSNHELRRCTKQAMRAVENLVDMHHAFMRQNGCQNAIVTYDRATSEAQRLVIWLMGLNPNAELLHRDWLLKYCGEHVPYLRNMDQFKNIEAPGPVTRNRWPDER